MSHELWRAFPGLYRHEEFRGAALVSAVILLRGRGLRHYVVFPMIFRFFVNTAARRTDDGRHLM
jgi:Sec-independent protein secretion pathway component TatC